MGLAALRRERAERDESRFRAMEARRAERMSELEARNVEQLRRDAGWLALTPMQRREQRAIERASRMPSAAAPQSRTLLPVPSGPGMAAPTWATVPKGAGFCGPQTARCAGALRYDRDMRPCCRAINVELLAWVADLFTRMGVTWWADYGTLLGAVRHSGIIPWDKDTDLGILEDDRRKVLELEPELRRIGLGFSGRRLGPIKFMASRQNRTNCDVFAWHEKAGVMHRHSYANVDDFKGKAFGKDKLFPLTTVEWEGLTLPAPGSVRMAGATPAPHVPGFEAGSWFLEHRYGPGWHTPLHANNDGVRRP